jgi:hypothetical protein
MGQSNKSEIFMLQTTTHFAEFLPSCPPAMVAASRFDSLSSESTAPTDLSLHFSCSCSRGTKKGKGGKEAWDRFVDCSQSSDADSLFRGSVPCGGAWTKRSPDRTWSTVCSIQIRIISQHHRKLAVGMSASWVWTPS